MTDCQCMKRDFIRKSWMVMQMKWNLRLLWKNCPKCWQFTMGQLLSLSLMNMILLFRKDIQKIFMMRSSGFMRNFFSGAFKDNRNLSYGFLTGILRIAQESIFSGLNNLTVNSVMDKAYGQYFGFTEQEVYQMLDYYHVSEKRGTKKLV